MPFYTDPLTKVEYKFAWYHFHLKTVISLTSIVIIAFAVTVQQTVRILIGRCFTFEKKADRSHNVINVVHCGKIDLFIRDVSVLIEYRIADKEGLQKAPTCQGE